LCKKFKSLGFEFITEHGHACDIAARPVEAGYETKLHGIAAERNDDWNCFGRSDGGNMCATRPDQHRWLAAN
jgi:hypothetical protein